MFSSGYLVDNKLKKVESWCTPGPMVIESPRINQAGFFGSKGLLFFRKPRLFVTIEEPKLIPVKFGRNPYVVPNTFFFSKVLCED